MRRRLFTLCSALSLLLFLAVCTLWARSCWRHDSVTWYGSHPSGVIGVGDCYVGIQWGGGVVSLYVLQPDVGGAAEPERWRWSSAPETDTVHYRRFVLHRGPDTLWWRLGFSRDYSFTREGGRVTQWMANYYAHFGVLTISTAVLPASWLGFRLAGRLKRRSAGQYGLCPACGYDLRATPGRCPECGAATANPAGPSPANAADRASGG